MMIFVNHSGLRNKMNAECLIIFYKNPELGKVKTRLAATTSNEFAHAVYLKLVLHTRYCLEHVPVHVFVFYSDHIQDEDLWKPYRKMRQQGADLGMRMQQAFETVFALGYRSVCIIGTDCLELQPIHLNQAFQLLREYEIVIGPAKDGGYYLLGMKALHPEFFKEKKWSGSTVFSETLRDVKKLDLTFNLLPELSDVDVEDDLPQAWRK